MTNGILGFGAPGAIEILIILIVLGIPIALVIVFARYLTKNRRENQRLRLEVGKLADEVERMRKKNEAEGSAGSGGSG